MNKSRICIYLIYAVFLFNSSSTYSQDALRFIDLGPDTTLCEGEYLLVGNDVSTDTCFTNFVWWDGTLGYYRTLYEPGTYWVDVQSQCGNYSDTIHVNVIQCDPGCGANSQFSGRYGGGKIQKFSSCMAPIPDGSGFYVTGYKGDSISTNARSDSIFVARVNLIGEIEWMSAFMLIDDRINIPNALIVDPEGMLALAVTTSFNSALAVSANVIRFNPLTRQVLWARQYPIEDFDITYSLILDPDDGNYLVATSRHGVFKVNHQNGDLIPIGNGATALQNVTFKDMVEKNGFLYGVGLVVVGFEDYPRFLLSKIRVLDGQEIWSMYGDSIESIGEGPLAPDLVIDNNFVYAIYSDQNQILHVLKSDLNANLIWIKEYIIPGQRIDANEIIKTEHGFIIMSEIYDTREIVLMELNAGGDLIWKKCLTTPNDFLSLRQADKAVGQILELNHNLFYTVRSVGYHGDEPQILITRLTSDGDPISSCLYKRIPEMESLSDSNPVFVPINIQKRQIEINSIARFPELSKTWVEPQPACFFSNVIYTSVYDTLCPGQIIEGYTDAGIYTDTFPSVIGCDSIRVLSLAERDHIQTQTTQYICEGAEYEGYSQSGIYTDTFPLLSGCDSVRILHLFTQACKPIVRYDLDACRSYMSDGSNMDYSEFVPSYPNSLSCGDVEASTLHREQIIPQKHSCTPGINGTPAICISIDTGCVYIPGSTASLIAEITINPAQDSIVGLTGIQFYQRGPDQYSWIDGPSGPNDYATLFGIRVLKNNQEIYRKEAISSSPDWELVSFNFTDNDNFRVTEKATFTIKILPYCPVGNGAEVKAWEVDDFEIFGTCWPAISFEGILKGNIQTISGAPMPGVMLHVMPDDIYQLSKNETTGTSGIYSFSGLPGGKGYMAVGYLDSKPLLGVSTYDLVLLEQHLLGRKPFTSLAQFVAADADHNGRVNVFDLLAIHKAILGYIPTFPKNTSWRIGVWPQDFSRDDPDQFKEEAIIESIGPEETIQNFIGIKIGDISGNVSPYTPEIVYRSAEEATINISYQYAKEESGVINTIDFIAGEDMDLSGIQCALDFSSIMDFSLEKESLPISQSDYSVSNGILRVSWFTANSKHVSKGSVLWKIQISSNKLWQRQNFQVLDSVLQQEAYFQNGKILKLKFSNLKSMDIAPKSSFLEIWPNPAIDEIHLLFQIDQDSPVDINIYDLTGRTRLHKQYSNVTAGKHEELIKLGDIDLPSGLYLAQVTNAGIQMNKTFLILN